MNVESVVIDPNSNHDDVGKSTLGTKESYPELMPNYQTSEFIQAIKSGRLNWSQDSSRSRMYIEKMSNSTSSPEILVREQPTIKWEIKNLSGSLSRGLNLASSRIDLKVKPSPRLKKAKKCVKHKKRAPKFGSSWVLSTRKDENKDIKFAPTQISKYVHELTHL